MYRSLGIALFALLIVVTAWAQSPQAAVQAVMQRALGSAAMPQDMTLIGDVTHQGQTEPFRLLIKGNRKMRYETGVGRTLRIRMYDNGDGWTSEGDHFKPIEFYAAAQQRPNLVPLLDLVSELGNTHLAVSNQSSQSPAGTAALRLQLPDAAPAIKRFRGRPLDETVDVDIDANSSLVTRTTRTLISDSNMDFRVPSVTEFSDYRLTQGLMIPFRITTRTGTPQLGVFESTVVWYTVYVNSGLADTLFRPQ